jgi:hypothetical protein
MMMSKAKILSSLELAFSDLDYPYGRDFYRAIADRDYEDYVASGKEKRWNEVTKDDIRKYYDLLYFLCDDASVIYYLPAFIKYILKNGESENEEDANSAAVCSTCVFTVLEKLDPKLLSQEQHDTVCAFLEYCLNVIYSECDLDQEPILTAKKNFCTR